MITWLVPLFAPYTIISQNKLVENHWYRDNFSQSNHFQINKNQILSYSFIRFSVHSKICYFRQSNKSVSVPWDSISIYYGTEYNNLFLAQCYLHGNS